MEVNWTQHCCEPNPRLALERAGPPALWNLNDCHVIVTEPGEIYGHWLFEHLFEVSLAHRNDLHRRQPKAALFFGQGELVAMLFYTDELVELSALLH